MILYPILYKSQFKLSLAFVYQIGVVLPPLYLKETGKNMVHAVSAKDLMKMLDLFHPDDGCMTRRTLIHVIISS